MASKKVTKKPRKEKVPVKSEVKKSLANVTAEKVAVEAAKEVKPEGVETVKEVEAEVAEAAKETAKEVEAEVVKTAKEAAKEEEPKVVEAAKETAKEVEAEVVETAKETAKEVEPEVAEAVKETAKEVEPEIAETVKETAKEVKPEVSKAVKTVTKEVKPKAAKATKETAKEVKGAAKEVKPEAAKAAKEVAKEVAPEGGKAVKTEEPQEICTTPRKSVVFIGSECYPFVKTGGLGDVMYSLPKALVKQNCDVKVIIPRYKCIPEKYQKKMVYKGSFDMNLCADGKSFYVGIMEYVWDGVVYDFIDNEEFFSSGNPYISLIDDIPKYCYFAKAALAALNYLDWVPDIIHCHDWQAALTPVYLRTLFENTKLAGAKTILTIHNLRFQGIYNIPKIRYWSGLPDYVFNKDALKEGQQDANMLKGGLTYANIITTVSNTYAGEIQTPYYGEKLDAHLRYHSGKLRGIVNGIDYDIWNTSTDSRLYANYDSTDVLDKKKENKRSLQEELGLVQDDHKFVIGLISRLTNQKGLDLVNSIMPQIMDEHTQVVILGTGDSVYEDSFRYYENAYKGNVCSNIMYDETRAHRIYAGADAFLVPSQFEPCGLTQLIAMHYGTVPIVRETGGLKDTVEPYNMYSNTGNGYTFDRYEAGLLLDAINRAKTLYFTGREYWDEMVQRDMDKNLSWDNSAKQYKDLYLELG